MAFRGGKNDRKKFLAVWVFLSAATIFSGCEATVEQACQEFRLVQGDLTIAQKTVREQLSDRRLASVDGGGDERREDRRQYWMGWTESLLKKTQTTQDALSHQYQRSAGVQSLNEAAMLLTSLHGFFEQEKWAKAEATLVQLRAKYVEAAERGCFSVREPASE